MGAERAAVLPLVPAVALRRLWPLVAVVLLAVGGQTIAVFHPYARPWIMGVSVLLMDVLGVAYCWKAARGSVASAAQWRLIGAARAASVARIIALSAASFSGVLTWWWIGTLSRLLMYVLLAVGVLLGAAQHLHGRGRRALLVEVVTVLAAGFMLVWYFALEPILDHQRPSYTWVSTIGVPLGDVLLVAAVAAALLRGAKIRITAPATVLIAGLICTLVADVTWAALGVNPERATLSMLPGMSFVLAALLLTLAPMLAAYRPRALQLGTDTPPVWAGHLPVVAMAVGCTLMLAVILLEDQMLPWGGLICGLIVMTCAASARQVMSIRESRSLIVTDPLTGLANRTGLERGIDRALKRRDPIALLLIDLDGFKLINDAYGHASGDTVLIEFAHQLRSAVRAGQAPARIGGDEFAVVLTDTTADKAASVARRILAVAATSPVRLDDDTVPVRASIGIALARSDDTTQELMRRADVALYNSKRAGTHAFTVYDPTMVDRRAEDAVLSDHLDGALDSGELHLVYQPIVDLTDGRPIGAEALLRWQHPTLGLVPPVKFIPIAERSGTITIIGLWVLEQALQQLRTFHDHQTPADRPMRISVNLSPRQLQEPTIVSDILAVLKRTGVDPHHLTLEITESAIVDETSGIAALRSLRTHGIRIAIDDFGTGYSSLQYLTRLPVDVLKIDRCFIAELNSTPEGAAVTEAIIRLAQILNLTTVAEGIETPEQAAELEMLGCDTGQGYLFAKPLPAAALVKILTKVHSKG